MDVCAKLRSILHVKKIGHAGTLDPMAEGVLPVALGRATKNISLVGEGIKEYRAGMLLGLETDTEDITGTELGRFEGEFPADAAIREAVLSFVGEYEQLTPMYSARKVNGKKLYEYARAGIEVERKSRKVTIYDIQIEEISPPHVRFTVKCSQGTYIRTLCSDIGAKLGCGACMEALERTQVGSFRAEDALRIQEVAELEAAGGIDRLLWVKAPTAISIGKFDGTHLGHQALLRELRKMAEKNRLRTLVIILKFGRAGVLSDEERKAKLYELGIDYCIELEFTEELKAMSAEEFLEKILIGRFNMKAIVGGKDISFGRGKAGNAEFLYANAEKYGYLVDLIDKVRIDEARLAADAAGADVPDADRASSGKVSDGSAASGGASSGGADGAAENSAAGTAGAAGASGESVVISSTLLREKLQGGEMEEVRDLMGSYFRITGTVVHGKGIAHSKMQYPTMNVEVPENLTLPPFGVYAVRARILHGSGASAGKGGSGKTPPFVQYVDGIANLGERPTVNGSVEGGSRLRLEVHAFEDPGDCYGEQISVELCRFIRPERKFDSLEELTRQIKEQDLPAVMAFFQKSLAEKE